MQWLIDLVVEAVLASIQNVIVMWFKPIADIPDGWGLCDGTQGLPDLRDKFIRGTAVGVDPGETGGSSSHTHDFSAGAHDHDFDTGDEVAAGEDFDDTTDSTLVTGTTDAKAHLPPFYEMVFIGKL